MFKVFVNRGLLLERQRQEEIGKLVEGFFRELSEAVAPTDISKIMGKYMGKVKDPNARNDFLMQAASFLGRKSNVSPEELDLVLRQHFAKNYDPAKLARRQTPAQKAADQSASKPPPLPQQKPQFQPPSGAMPSLSKLAAQETEPFWKKHGLPSPDQMGVGKKGDEEPPTPAADKGANDDDDEDLPTAKPGDVRSIKPKAKPPAEKEPEKKAASAPARSAPAPKEVDPEDIGDKDPEGDDDEKPVKSEPEKKKKKKAGKKKISKDDLEDVPDEEDSVKAAKGIPMPSISSLVNQKLKPGADLGDPKWKVGDTVSIGHAGDGYKVKNKTGSWYNLTRNGEKYVFIPFRGLQKIRGS